MGAKISIEDLPQRLFDNKHEMLLHRALKLHSKSIVKRRENLYIKEFKFKLKLSFLVEYENILFFAEWKDLFEVVSKKTKTHYRLMDNCAFVGSCFTDKNKVFNLKIKVS